ncbi:MAG: endonuclease/exonuclease/phosphatase family protein, partial [Paracoccaceae bacterium]
DLGLRALSAFAGLLAASGAEYPYKFALAPNSGVFPGLDMDGDGRSGTPADAQGYGRFAGQGGMALLSRLPIDADGARDFSGFLWKDFPDAIWPAQTAAEVMEIQRLSSVAHWDVPVILPDGSALHLLAYHASTPVFDGPEDRNGRRNYDQNVFWLRYLEGALPWTPPDEPFVIFGDANLDPVDGAGRRSAIRALLAYPGIQDPRPKSAGAVAAASAQGGANLRQRGDPAFDTADWRDVDGPGNLRVDYVLPSRDLRVLDAGVFWPAPDEAGAAILNGRDPDVGWHGLVWVDVGW